MPSDTVNTLKYLVSALRKNKTWTDLIAAADATVFTPYRQRVLQLLETRHSRYADDQSVKHLINLLGLKIPLGDFDNDQRRLLLESLPELWKIAATDDFVQILRYVLAAYTELVYLYCNRKVSSDNVSFVDTGEDFFDGILSHIPAYPGTVRVEISGLDPFIDNGLGVLVSTDGSGTINYTTGAFHIDLNDPVAAPTPYLSKYNTKKYRQFFPEEQSGTLTHQGGDWYLTNHVSLEYDIEVFPVVSENLDDIFEAVAPAVLVLEELIGVLYGLSNPIFLSAEAHITEYVQGIGIPPPPDVSPNMWIDLNSWYDSEIWED